VSREADEIRPEEAQVQARVLAAFGGGLALTAVLPGFARRRPFTLVVGALIAAVAMARLTR